MRALESVVIGATKAIAFFVIACELVGSTVLNAVGLARLDGGIRRTLIGAALILLFVVLLVAGARRVF
jgi:hypothetical protein